MQITISGVGPILQRVQRYVGIDIKIKEVIKRLCAIGEPIIAQTHANHAEVKTEDTKTGSRIYAKGKDVLFIEFGTGDMAGVMDALYEAVPSSVGQGTWSESHAQMYTRYGFWVFAGAIYHYTEPHPAFYYAYQAMMQALPQIVEDVFK